MLTEPFTLMQALERQKQVNALAVPPPDHWLAVPNTSTVFYLPLPFEGGAAPAEPHVDPSTVHEMTRQVGSYPLKCSWVIGEACLFQDSSWVAPARIGITNAHASASSL